MLVVVPRTADDTPTTDDVAVLWTPLGADGPAVVRASGRAFETLVAARERRRPLALFHAALEVRLDGSVVHAEMTPVWGQPPGDRGVLAEGPVGARVLGRSRFFRYEVRCRSWTAPLDPHGATTRRPVPLPGTPRRAPSTDAVGPAEDAGPTGPTRPGTDGDDDDLHDDPARRCARAVLDAAAHVPLLVWGRRAPSSREMWNSNSVVAWLLARAGVDALAVRPPEGGRAPGWHAGAVAARATDHP